jgi:hypothetical protein
MAGTIGLRLNIDASDSKSQIDALSGAVKGLNENIREMNHSGSVPPISSSAHLPRFMGSGEAGLRPGELSAIPDARVATQIMPRMVPGITGQSIYGINSYNGQISPGGIFPDGRRMPNTQFNIEQVKDQIEGLGDVIEGLTRDLQEAWKNGDLQSVNNISSALENAKSTELSMRNQVKGYEREEKDREDRNDPMKQFGDYIGAHLATQIAQSLVTAGNTIVGSQKTLAGGDYAGAMVQREKGIGELIGGGLGTGLGALIGSFIAPGVGTIAGAGIGGMLGKFVGGLSGDFSERDLAFSQNYKNALPGMESFYQRFGTNINIRTGEENGRIALDWYNRASDMSYGTGKTTEELMQAAQNRAAYGNFSGEEALSGAREDIMWERYTGANLSNIQRTSGLALRYGGDTEAIQKAFSGLQASGMGKGQFDEFLTSMQRIMEDGIEKGFVRGADEIAGNMSMLSKLSGGNALWTGEQGAKRLGEMNTAMYNATNLRTIEDTISFSAVNRILGEDNPETSVNERELNFYRLNGGLQKATLTGNPNFRSSASDGDNIMGQLRKGQNVDILGMEGEYAKVNSDGREGYVHKSLLDIQRGTGYNVPYTGTYIDNMITLERGMRPELLGEQMRAVREMDGEGNKAGQIERYRTMFGLNYTGASKVWEMSKNEDFIKNPERYSREIEDIRTKAEYKSDAQKLQDAITKLTTEGINVGHITFDKVEMPYLKEATEEMQKIHEDLLRKYEEQAVPMLNSHNPSYIRQTINNEDLVRSNLSQAKQILEKYDNNGENYYDMLMKELDYPDDDMKNIPHFGNSLLYYAKEFTRDDTITNDEINALIKGMKDVIETHGNNQRPLSVIFPDTINVIEMS